MNNGIPCWPNGTDSQHGRDCEATLPNTDHKTLEQYGWGFVCAPDTGSCSGQGMFYACPDHRDDCTEGARAEYRRRYEKAREIDAAAAKEATP